MRLRIIICLIFVLSAFSGIDGQTLTKRDTLDLAIPTTINYDLADWDTVFAVITHLGSLIDTVGLSHAEPGRWRGTYPIVSLLGSYQIEYYAVYGSDTTPEFISFSVIDTAAFHGEAAGLTAGEVADSLEGRGWGLGACGVGSEEITVKVYEADADSEVCDNCEVKFYLVDDSDFSDRRLIANSGTNGFIPILSVDPDSYMVVITQSDWSFDVETVLVQDLDQLQTFYLTGTKSDRSDTTVVLYGYVRDAGWNFVEGAEVTIKLDMREPIIPTISGTSDIVITSVMDTTNAVGKWQVTIVPNEYISPSGTRYKVTYEKEDVILVAPERTIIVPWSETDININSL